MHVLNIVSSPRKEQSVSRAVVDAFFREYMKQADDIVIDTLNVWQERLPEFDAETIDAKYKGVSGEQRKGSETRMEGKARFVFPVVITAIIVFVVSGAVTLFNIGWRNDFVIRWWSAFAIGWPIATSTAYVAMPFARSLTQRIIAAIERTV
jgi:Protein of unknown function (DUF2798)/Flavodoxin-like fold